MSTPDTSSVSRLCDLLLREAFKQTATAISLEPEGDKYLVFADNHGVSEQIAAPPAHISLGLFVHLCQRANVSAEVCTGSFGFLHDGRTRQVDMRVLNGPKGKRAELKLGPEEG